MSLLKAYGTPYWSPRGGVPLGRLGDTLDTWEQIFGAQLPDQTQQAPVSSNPPAGSGWNWNTFDNVANSLTKNFASIYRAVQPVPPGCTTVTSPNGQQYMSCAQAGQPTPVPGVSFSTGAGGGSSVLLIGAIVVVGGLIALSHGGGR